jgi:hypothetical protein
MSKLAILLGASPSMPYGEEAKSSDDNSSETDAGYEMFKAFVEALGITPKDEKKAYNRFCALYKIWDDDSEGSY